MLPSLPGLNNGSCSFLFPIINLLFFLLTKGLRTWKRVPWAWRREMAWLCREKVPLPLAPVPKGTCYTVMVFPSSIFRFQGPSFFLPQSALWPFWFFTSNIHVYVLQVSLIINTKADLCVKYDDQYSMYHYKICIYFAIPKAGISK